MAFSLTVVVPPNPATGNTDGQVVNLYKASRFTDPTTAPATNTAPPGGGADYGPVTTGPGQLGAAVFAPTTFEAFMAEIYDPTDTSNGGTYNVYWI